MEFNGTDQILGPLSAHQRLNAQPNKSEDSMFDLFCELMSKSGLLRVDEEDDDDWDLFDDHNDDSEWFERESLWNAYCNHLRPTPLVVRYEDSQRSGGSHYPDAIRPQDCIDVFNEEGDGIPTPFKQTELERKFEQIPEEERVLSKQHALAKAEWVSIVPPTVWALYIDKTRRRSSRKNSSNGMQKSSRQ